MNRGFDKIGKKLNTLKARNDYVSPIAGVGQQFVDKAKEHMDEMLSRQSQNNAPMSAQEGDGNNN
jgi:hypothetical protein